MTTPPVERLSDRQYVVLLIRALVDERHDHLLSGEVGGPDEDGPERWVRFREPGDLPAAVDRWLAGRPRAP
jgi:hypothetical protein